ncbi:MAG: sulfatase-like hydrolase/transferase, partial [Candidatus Lokiarchaeota archaeon]|nr:sulfatase-like hydrolase/transferase [Candidatus Lokiarchaeota archaeon]
DQDYGDNWIGRQGVRLIQNAPNNKPWFLVVNFNGPHSPMDVTKSMRERWRDVISFPMPVDSDIFTEEENIGIRQNYSAMVENIDSWIAKFKQEIERRGESNNTIIVYASDHGEMLGDHNRKNKCVPWQGAVNVPLVIAGPNIENQEEIKHPVSLIDLYATFLDIAGVQIPKGVDSVSLKPVLERKKKVSERFVRSGLWNFRVVIRDKYKLVVGYRPTKTWKNEVKIFLKGLIRGQHHKKVRENKPIMLFDLANDPDELNNIAEDNPEIVMELKKNLLSPHLKDQ